MSMGTVMQRENERGRLTVPGCRIDDGGWRSLVVVREVGRRRALYPHGAPQLGVCLEQAEAVRAAEAIMGGVR